VEPLSYTIKISRNVTPTRSHKKINIAGYLSHLATGCEIKYQKIRNI